jgi:hypothetical protein
VKRSDIDEFVEWVKACPGKPNQRTIANKWPTIWVRYPRVVALVDHIWPPPDLLPPNFELNEWQQELDGQLREIANDRSIVFVVDNIGSSGKSMFVRHQLTHYPEETQVLKLGKRDDLAFAIDPSKRVSLPPSFDALYCEGQVQQPPRLIKRPQSYQASCVDCW